MLDGSLLRVRRVHFGSVDPEIIPHHMSSRRCANVSIPGARCSRYKGVHVRICGMEVQEMAISAGTIWQSLLPMLVPTSLTAEEECLLNIYKAVHTAISDRFLTKKLIGHGLR